MIKREQVQELGVAVLAVLLPVVLTAILTHVTLPREYIYSTWPS